MADITPLRKAMIVIAVSKYKGLPDLPGTLTSANRIADWAQGDSPARNYSVLKITDEDCVDEEGEIQLGEPVTRDRLEAEIRPFIENHIWDRVVVYFAGHGMMGTGLTDYWLLHDAKGDPADGVNFLLFKTAMERQGIGSLSSTVGLDAGQVCYIVDACRTVEGDLSGFSGSPILKWPNDLRPLETDIFLSAIQGSYAFQPNAVEGIPPYCLFSDALSDALEGRVSEVIETEYHKYAPVITSSSLARWIREEVPKRARKFNEALEADPRPGFVTFNDFYEVFDPIAEDEAVQRSVPDEDGAGEDGPNYGVFVDAESDMEELNRLSELDWNGNVAPEPNDEKARELFSIGGRIVRDYPEPEQESAQGEAAYAMISARAFAGAAISIEGRRGVCVPAGMRERLEEKDSHLNYHPSLGPLGGQPIFVQNTSDNDWTVVPAFSNATSSVLLTNYPGSVFLVDLHGMLSEPDLSLTCFAGQQPSRMSDAMKLADAIRPGKSIYPNKANRAGYLYYLSSDRANALRTAHFMARDDLLGFDLALVAAQSINFIRDGKGQWLAYADLAAIGSDEDDASSRPRYTRASFDARKNVPLTSPFPIYRQGWDLLQIAGIVHGPSILNEIAVTVRGRNVATFSDEALDLLAKNFHYSIHHIGS